MGTDRTREVPVLLIIFNRPRETAAVLQALQVARPARLLVAADGARPNRPEDLALCAETRSLIESMVTWPCEVLTNFSQENMGCRNRPASAIAWALQLFEETIVLEDDCVPHPDFFPFVAEMLDQYREDERVMLVSGINVLGERRPLPYSYAFSRYTLTWGWATWRRKWEKFDLDIENWPQIRDAGILYDLLGDRQETKYWIRSFDVVWRNVLDTWDYQLQLAMWTHGAYSVYPAKNLITNIGTQGTHFSRELPMHNLKTYELKFPLQHPPIVYRDLAADALIRSVWYVITFGDRLRQKAKRILAHIRH